MDDFFKQNGLYLEEYNLKQHIGIDFWHTSVLNELKVPMAGGSGNNVDQSRKIAYSEYLERFHFQKIKQSSAKTCEQWGIDLISSGCGFAAGFNEYNTIVRSLGEAVERRTMSKWIDDEFIIEKVDSAKVQKELDPASKWFYSQFDRVDFYNKNIVIQFSNKFFISFSGSRKGWERF